MKSPQTAVTRPAVCELWCQISGTGLLLPPQEKQVITRLSLGKLCTENMMEQVIHFHLYKCM